MTAKSASFWARSYRELIEAIPGFARNARLALCGMNACVDARISMHDMAPLLGASGPREAVAFRELIKARAARGIGGEVRVDWPEGPVWLASHLPIAYALGGTGPQAGRTLAAVGAPALVALQDRSAHMLEQFHPQILIAQNGRCVPASNAERHGPRRPEIFIFEYTAGRPIGDIVPPRSSRIIVRFHDPGLEHDPEFDALSIELAPSSGVGLISGFNAVPQDKLHTEISSISMLARKWRAGGVAVVHLELAGYDSPELRDAVIEGTSGSITSLGMSHSEFVALAPPGANLADGMCELANRFGLQRLCVHADHWAAAATRSDPDTECQALAMGCLLAGTRASVGIPAHPREIDQTATFAAPPIPEVDRRGGWSILACPSPHLEHPKATVGLGDSFTGGCLLVLGQAAGVRRLPPTA